MAFTDATLGALGSLLSFAAVSVFSFLRFSRAILLVLLFNPLSISVVLLHGLSCWQDESFTERLGVSVIESSFFLFVRELKVSYTENEFLLKDTG